MNTRTLLAAFLMLSVAACAEPEVGTQEAADPAAKARAAVAQAEARYAASAEAGHAWRQPKALIEDARQALEAGDFETALNNADRAIAMADASLAQAEAEKSAWRHRLPFSS
jgi:hypothetical protein